MDRPSEILFAYSRWFGALSPWLWLTPVALVILIILAAAFLGLHTAYAQTGEGLLPSLRALAVLAAGVWMSASFVYWIRDRHAYRTRYLLTGTAVLVKSLRGDETSLSWSDFDRAVDSRVGRCIQLFSSRLDKPVTLVFGTPGYPGLAPRHKLDVARRLVRDKLGERYSRVWW